MRFSAHFASDWLRDAWNILTKSVLRFVPNRSAFCTKQAGGLVQNASSFGTKWGAIRHKTHRKEAKSAPPLTLNSQIITNVISGLSGNPARWRACKLTQLTIICPRIVMKCSIPGSGAYTRITDIYACRDLHPVSQKMDLPRHRICHGGLVFACRDLPIASTYAL